MFTKYFKTSYVLIENLFFKKYYYDEEMKENTENSTRFLIFIAYLSTVHLLLSFTIFTYYLLCHSG